MPVFQYSVLKGDAQSGKLSSDSKPHYLIDVTANGKTYEIAVNIESTDGSEVLYFLNDRERRKRFVILSGARSRRICFAARFKEAAASRSRP